MQIDRVSQQCRDDEPYCIDQRPFHRPEDCSVHDRERICHGERRGGYDGENGDGKQHGERPERPQEVLDVGLFRNDESRQ